MPRTSGSTCNGNVSDGGYEGVAGRLQVQGWRLSRVAAGPRTRTGADGYLERSKNERNPYLFPLPS